MEEQQHQLQETQGAAMQMIRNSARFGFDNSQVSIIDKYDEVDSNMWQETNLPLQETIKDPLRSRPVMKVDARYQRKEKGRCQGRMVSNECERQRAIRGTSSAFEQHLGETNMLLVGKVKLIDHGGVNQVSWQ